mmetsp:Transcript_10733/g.23443  ORF Transcript_10733/g.23443 Transcript_10733/m.23443 type:complete len:89 (-) Transcript_10733:2-268(-)
MALLREMGREGEAEVHQGMVQQRQRRTWAAQTKASHIQNIGLVFGLPQQRMKSLNVGVYIAQHEARRTNCYPNEMTMKGQEVLGGVQA